MLYSLEYAQCHRTANSRPLVTGYTLLGELKDLEIVSQAGQKLVIDLNFPGQMNDTEMRSMVSQLMYSYGANKRAAQPCQLYFTSLQVTINPTPLAFMQIHHFQL